MTSTAFPSIPAHFEAEEIARILDVTPESILLDRHPLSENMQMLAIFFPAARRDIPRNFPHQVARHLCERLTRDLSNNSKKRLNLGSVDQPNPVAYIRPEETKGMEGNWLCIGACTKSTERGEVFVPMIELIKKEAEMIGLYLLVESALTAPPAPVPPPSSRRWRLLPRLARA